ncbi:MAG: Crp/Fnr family transcriptional regulator [Flammeovirgaceae bacterium]|jgi:CRP-like cAMP-binding protein|nr:Crp/Fnr family transcriptional regulator [Flammeovirgaceae bacterium]
MKDYIDKINLHIENLDDETLISLETISKSKTFSKGEYLLKAGSVCTKSYWMESGIIRKFYRHQEREITTEFYFKDDLAISFDSYTLQKPSREDIQVLTDCVVRVTDFTAFQSLKMKNRQLLELDFLLTEYYALWLEEKVFELHTQNATQRYQTLLKKSPHIIQQVQLTQIASYLNISLETLSRIRAKI